MCGPCLRRGLTGPPGASTEPPGASQGFVAARQLVEQLLVEPVALLPRPRGHEDVASDELVDDLAVGRHAAEGNVHVTVKLDGHLESSETVSGEQ